jgi:DNA-binding transcriptional LysR family regulator
VTFQIRQLEEYFNTRLFDRTHNRISLTAAGERVFEYAERIVALYSEMDIRVRELTGDVSGILIIGASTTIAEYMLPSLLGTFKEKHPGINIRLKVSNSEGIVHMVEDNSVDVGMSVAIVTRPVVGVCNTTSWFIRRQHRWRSPITVGSLSHRSARRISARVHQ